MFNLTGQAIFFKWCNENLVPQTSSTYCVSYKIAIDMYSTMIQYFYWLKQTEVQ